MDRSGSERAELNRFLARHGFAELSDHGLLPQLALCVEDEATLKRVLNLTTPEERTSCYESLRPHLRFEVRPLDVLLAEIAMDAEIRQLPVITENGGLRAYNPTVVTGTLTLICGKCGKHEYIRAISRAFAVEVGEERGWTSVADILHCPECSKEVHYAVDPEASQETPE